MRSKQALKNMSASMILQVIIFMSGIILPRFFLKEYGSQINGLVTSINQFLTYLGLAEAGVGTASVVALYGPIADNNDDRVNSILSATKRYYSKIGGGYLVLLVLLAAVFPVLINKQLSPSLVISMVLVMGSSTFINLYFIGKYKVYLTAKQEGYILSAIEAVGTFLNMGISIWLICQGCNVVIVKSIATVIYLLRFFVIKIYINKKYPELDYNAEPDYTSLGQRGAVLLHQIVGIIVNNTDVVLLTVMLGSKSLLEVSVYGIYNMVVYAINLLLNSFSNGLTAGFGEVVFKKEDATLQKSFSNYEYLFYIVFSVVCVCLAVLLLPFVGVYTNNVTDVKYVRTVTAGLFVIILFLQNVRIPSMTIICAAGHFKETRRQAVLEAVINMAISLILIKRWGMNGVLVGTICSYGYRSFEMIWYNQKYLVKGSGKTTYLRLIRNVAVGICVIWGCLQFVPQKMKGFVEWGLYACLTGGVAMVVILIVNVISEPESFRELWSRMKGIIKR